MSVINSSLLYCRSSVEIMHSLPLSNVWLEYLHLGMECFLKKMFSKTIQG